MATWFTSDTHFGDHRTLNIGRRPFAGVAEMDAVLVASWNAAVGPEDEVWHLGDFARRASDAAGLLARLNGVKHLVRGNNDPPGTSMAEGWASVQDYKELEADGVRLVGNLLGDPLQPLEIGASVVGVFEHHSATEPPFTLLQWQRER